MGDKLNHLDCFIKILAIANASRALSHNDWHLEDVTSASKSIAVSRREVDTHQS